MFRIDSCKFQREEGSKWEPGIDINSDKVIDANGHEVKKMWDFRVTPDLAVDFSALGTYMPILEKVLALVADALHQKEVDSK